MTIGDGSEVDIARVHEADALYRAGSIAHLGEVKRTPAALKNRMRASFDQLENLAEWRALAPDREVMLVVETEDGRTRPCSPTSRSGRTSLDRR